MNLSDIPTYDPNRFRTTDGHDDPERTNQRRADDAEAAITQPQELRCEEDFSDLITNLLHLSHRRGHDQESILRVATENFLAEAGPLPA